LSNSSTATLHRRIQGPLLGDIRLGPWEDHTVGPVHRRGPQWRRDLRQYYPQRGTQRLGMSRELADCMSRFRNSLNQLHTMFCTSTYVRYIVQIYRLMNSEVKLEVCQTEELTFSNSKTQISNLKKTYLIDIITRCTFAHGVKILPTKQVLANCDFVEIVQNCYRF